MGLDGTPSTPGRSRIGNASSPLARSNRATLPSLENEADMALMGKEGGKDVAIDAKRRQVGYPSAPRPRW